MTNFKKYFYFSLFAALINLALIIFIFTPRYDHSDTFQYISTIENLAGDKTAEIFPSRILKPLPILLGVFFAPVFRAENTLIFQNIFFYLFSICLTYFLVFRLYHNEKQAFYGTVLYGTSYPMLAYGLASLTDLAGWFFFLAVVLLSLLFLKNPNFKIAGLTGLVAGFGMLFKESTAAAPIFFGSLIFIAASLPLKEKLKYILVFGLSFSFPVLVSSIVVYQLYSISYLDWYKNAWGGAGTKVSGHFYMVSPLRIIIESARVFLLGWLFVFLGAAKEIRQIRTERFKILLAFIFPSLSFFVWSFPHNRMMFIAAPFLVLLGSLGLLKNYQNSKINNLIELFLLSLYVLVNYVVLEFLLEYGPIIQPPGTLFG